MYDHLTDEQQIEFIKKIWKEYGFSLIIGIFIAVLLSFGWQYYQRYQVQHNEKASVAYETLMNDLRTGSSSEAIQQAETIKTNYPRTPYATLASFILAQHFVENHQWDQAAQELHWAIQQTHNRNFQQIARIRLARLQLAQGQSEEALKTLKSVDSFAFQGLRLDIQGDIDNQQGQIESARQAYQNAIASLPETTVDYPLLKMKLNNLAE